MKTVDIKGKKYVMVNERLKAFREDHSDYSLVTEIIELNGDACTMQAKIIDTNGRVIAIGTAREERDDKTSMVNRTSYVENCETSAWGRALGNFGIGIDESIATAEEVARAIEKQERIQSDGKPPQTNATTKAEEPIEMTLEQARKRATKSGKPFGDLTDEQLEYIVEHGGKQSSKAASLILRQRSEDDAPLIEEDLPF